MTDPPDRATGAYTIRVEARFESAHFLRSYRGMAEPMHGHSYRVEAELGLREGGVDGDAIAVDFVVARRELEKLAKRLDYGCLNEISPFTEINPSAENIARWFAEELGRSLENENENAAVRSVIVWEGPVNSVRYVPEPEG